MPNNKTTETTKLALARQKGRARTSTRGSTLAADLASYTTLSRSHTHREEVPALGDQSSTGNRQPKAKEKMASTGDGFVENAPVIKMEESETRPTFEELMKHQRLRSAVLLRVSNKTRSSCKSAEVSSK